MPASMLTGAYYDDVVAAGKDAVDAWTQKGERGAVIPSVKVRPEKDHLPATTYRLLPQLIA